MPKKCKYYAESPNVMWTPSCCVDEGFAFNSVHPDDVEEFCPFCGGKIKEKPFTHHPDLYDDMG